MLDLNKLLELVDLDPAETLVVRHVPVEKALKRVLPWLVVSRPDLWLAYQRIQWKTLEQAMMRARYVASFVGQESGTATLAGIYRIGEWQELDFEGYRAFPGNAELETLGMSGRDEEMDTRLAFELEALASYSDWIGRLMIGWPKPDRQWWRWAARGRFPVTSIATESRFDECIPDWRDIILSWQELQALPVSWKAALAQWRGIYYIFDVERRAGYVGSACGDENIFGRWSNYAKSGHGGNLQLRKSDPSNLRFSILERTSPDLDPSSVIALEATWKERLQTRTFGLNSN